MKNNDITFEYVEEFVDYIIDEVESDDDCFVEVIAKFDEAKEVLKETMSYGDVDFDSLIIEAPEMTGYADEFILSFWMDDGVLQIGCEKFKRDGEYFIPDGDIIFLFGNCSSKIIPLCEGSKLYFVDIEDECDCDEGCDEDCPCECHRGDSCVEYSKTDDGELHGFTASKSTDNGYHSYSFYTSDNLSKSDIHDMLREFGF